MSNLTKSVLADGANWARVELNDGGRVWTGITVSRPRAFGSEVKAAGVNWPGCGTQSPADTRAFALALLTACDLAEAMDSTTEATS